MYEHIYPPTHPPTYLPTNPTACLPACLRSFITACKSIYMPNFLNMSFNMWKDYHQRTPDKSISSPITVSIRLHEGLMAPRNGHPRQIVCSTPLPKCISTYLRTQRPLHQSKFLYTYLFNYLLLHTDLHSCLPVSDCLFYLSVCLSDICLSIFLTV